MRFSTTGTLETRCVMTDQLSLVLVCLLCWLVCQASAHLSSGAACTQGQHTNAPLRHRADALTRRTPRPSDTLTRTLTAC